MPKFEVISEYQPAGDQPQAIEALARGVDDGLREQVLLGVTGSGKTYTMAKVIEAIQRPTLVLAHNKTLAAQLCAEFKEFFPNNAVEYFVSYYDYYQPEAYIPHTDTYIAKDAATNDEIDRLRLSATCALLERRDVIVVASVSCIYGLGEPEDFAKMMISLRPGMTLERDDFLRRLVDIRYERNDIAFDRNMFRVRGDTVEVYPAYWRDAAIRVEFFGDEVDRISMIQPLTGAVTKVLSHVPIWPATHYVTPKDKMDRALVEIERELDKDTILSLYVNSINFGSGYETVAAASWGYFGKEPGQMNDWEATILAGIPNAPSAYSLDASPELAAQRQKQVLERMLRCDKITEEEVDSILAHNRVPVQEKIYLNAVIIKEN